MLLLVALCLVMYVVLYYAVMIETGVINVIKLKGLDISHHNKNIRQLKVLNNYDFIIMKATEGSTYADPAMSTYMNYLNSDMLKGFYHFARPENKNKTEAEASNFLSHVLKYLDGRCILALDVEAGALNVKDLDEWCLKWCQYVYAATGIKPLIYCSEAECYRFKKTAAFGCGLWVAKWGVSKPKKITPWKFYAIWQKSDKHLVSGVKCDLNYFNGDETQYIKYCRPEMR